MRYEITLRGPRGAVETVHVEAETGDDAAVAAFKPGHVISSVQPAPKAKKAAN